MTEYFQILATLAAIRIVLALVPGPEARLVAVAASRSRRHGVAAALGLALAGLPWAAIGVGSVDLVAAVAPRAIDFLRIAGGLHLLWLGTTAVRRSFVAPLPTPALPPSPLPLVRAFRAGALDLLTRPRAIVCAVSIFAVTGAWDFDLARQATAVAVLAAAALVWNVLLVVTFAPSTSGARLAGGRASARRLLSPLLGVAGRVSLGRR